MVNGVFSPFPLTVGIFVPFHYAIFTYVVLKNIGYTLKFLFKICLRLILKYLPIHQLAKEYFFVVTRLSKENRDLKLIIDKILNGTPIHQHLVPTLKKE